MPSLDAVARGGVIINVKGNLEAALRQLRNGLARDGVIHAVQRHEAFRPRGERRRLKQKRARTRARRAAERGVGPVRELPRRVPMNLAGTWRA